MKPKTKHADLRSWALVIIIIIIATWLASCGKQTDYGYLNTDRREPLVKYQHWVDHYSKDTTKLGVRTLWAQWFEPKQSTADHVTMVEQLMLNCITDSIEHWYYPIGEQMNKALLNTKLQPTRIDTNWTNYNKN